MCATNTGNQEEQENEDKYVKIKTGAEKKPQSFSVGWTKSSVEKNG
jgi:hypothetical protein